MPQRPLAALLSVDVDVPLERLMTRPVITAGLTVGLADIRALFERFAIHHVPIVDDAGAPAGMVSANDLERAGRWGVHAAEETCARDVMSSPVATVSVADSLAEAAALINRRRFHCLPVVDAEGKIAGILTAHDLIRLAYPGS